MRFRTLRARLLVPTLTLSVIVGLAAAILGTTLASRELEAQYVAHAQRTVDFVAKVGVPYVTNYDLTSLGTFAKDLPRDKQIAFAEFLDVDGKSMTADLVRPPADTAGLLVIKRDMKDDSGNVVGHVRVGFSNTAVVQARNHLLFTIAGAMLAVLCVVVGSLIWAARHVTGLLGAEPQAAVAVADAIASGDLTRETGQNRGDQKSLMAALERMRANLQRIVGDIRQASSSIQVSSNEIAQGHLDLSSRTEQQASSLEETAASMEEMTATVSQNAENAKKASGLAAGASEVAQAGGEAVRKVVQTMEGISAASNKIADIIGVIDSIAFQTNILALNAAVEAARAGEQGRGFAVVASEVRSLAQKSAAAAKEIRELITDSAGRVETGSEQVVEAGKTIDQVVGAVTSVNKLIAEISSASRDQAEGVSQVGGSVQQLEKVTQQNASMVEEATAASSSMREQAEVLMSAVSSFRLPGNMQGHAAHPALEFPKLEAKGPQVARLAPRGPAHRGNGELKEGWRSF
jgi:methyl-accepting chemotaxis protein